MAIAEAELTSVDLLLARTTAKVPGALVFPRTAVVFLGSRILILENGLIDPKSTEVHELVNFSPRSPLYIQHNEKRRKVFMSEMPQNSQRSTFYAPHIILTGLFLCPYQVSWQNQPGLLIRFPLFPDGESKRIESQLPVQHSPRPDHDDDQDLDKGEHQTTPKY